MYLPYDPLREAILLEFNRAISTRRAQGASFEALGKEYGLSKETVHLIAGRDEWLPEKRIAKNGRRCHPKP
jgi:hypothetical protein